MPTLRMLTLAATCTLGVLRPSMCLEDAQTLIQKAASLQTDEADGIAKTEEGVDLSLSLEDLSGTEGEDKDVSFGQDDWDGEGICKEKDLEDYQRRLDAYTKRQAIRDLRQAERQASAEKPKMDKLMKHYAWIDNFTNQTMGFLQEKYQPLVLRYIKGLFQTVDDRPTHWKEINLTKVANDIAKAFPQLEGKLKASLSSGLEAMDESLNAAVPALPHQVRKLPALQQELPKLEDNETVWANYFLTKYVPILAMEWEPSTATIVKLLGTMPPTSDPKFQSWLVKQITSTVLENALKPAVPGALVPQAASGQTPAWVAPPPKRHCATCWERYQELSWTMNNMNSCANHCFASSFNCIGGLNDACLVGVVPCLRCQRNRLQQFDQCEKQHLFDNEVGKLSDLMTIFKAGTEGFVPKIGEFLAN